MATRDRRLFIDNTKERVAQLIHTGVWSGMDQARCSRWIGQFEQVDCGLLAACLLDNLVYRSKDQVLALFKAALTCDRFLPHDAECDQAVIHALAARGDPGIRLVPVIALHQPPTKSGPYMLRLLARELAIRNRWMVWPDQVPTLPATVHTLVLIDDFCGSGQQFTREFMTTPAMSAARATNAERRIVYVAAAAHQNGLDAIAAAEPSIEVIAGEVLSQEHHFFDGDVLTQYQDSTLRDELLEQHGRFTERLALGRLPVMGFESQALTYAFAHGTPNNTLPIFWRDGPDWHNLLER